MMIIMCHSCHVQTVVSLAHSMLCPLAAGERQVHAAMEAYYQLHMNVHFQSFQSIHANHAKCIHEGST